ncbi:hypothetical protein ATN79_29100 [Paraburkholderia caribensis]|nr:hypothetical protein ATN79_29100 [Paraburkholderia caribensis]
MRDGTTGWSVCTARNRCGLPSKAVECKVSVVIGLDERLEGHLEADRERARELYAEIVHDAKHWPRHAREHNSEWLQRAQAALSR